MQRNTLITFRINDSEHRLIIALADRLQRTKSDAVRWLIRKAAHELDVDGNNVKVKSGCDTEA